jgi:hypothetical protein
LDGKTGHGERKKWDMTSELKTARAEFRAAIDIARHALEQFNAEPLIASKRGGPRLSPWFRTWVQASEVAQRWHRQVEREQANPGQNEVDEVIDEILGREGS